MATETSNVPVPAKMTFASVAAMALSKPSSQHSSRHVDSKAAKISVSGVAEHKLSLSIAKLDLGSAAGTTIAELEERQQDDANTHLSFSSVNASSDGKSVTSGTTFAMDEKESIRPDDSASVQAAEEDDSTSGHNSGAPDSRLGSEAGSRAFRDQFNEITERMGQKPVLPRPRILGIVEEAQPAIAAAIPAMPDGANAPFTFQYKEPDEKLMEAMLSPKDRLFLLQLEQQVISFVKESQEPVLDLPPCNSFCRLLAHRLGDYYALTHFVDNACVSVRLYRTPYCRLPTPLSSLAISTSASTIPSAAPSMKIMRRSEEKDGNPSGDNTASNSAVPSKAGSDLGLASPTESTTKDKSLMTREEREAHYKETRDRIFADASHAESVDESRASSASGKRKKTRNGDDGFEARSSYAPYYPQYSGSESVPGNFYAFQNFAASGLGSGPGASALPGMPPTSGLPMAYQHSPPYQPFPPMSAEHYQGLQSYYDPTMAAYPSTSQPTNPSGYLPSPTLCLSSQLSPAVQMPEQWPPFPSVYSTYPGQLGAQPGYGPGLVPYQYGQLPYQAGKIGRSPHPLPGSYTSPHRQAFNPQTSSFVPGIYNAGSRTFPPQGNGNGNPFPMPIPTQAGHFQSPNSSPRKLPSQYGQHSNGQSTLSKWATSANLPAKPPPSMATIQNGGGNGMPTFQNGTWSNPGQK